MIIKSLPVYSRQLHSTGLVSSMGILEYFFGIQDWSLKYYLFCLAVAFTINLFLCYGLYKEYRRNPRRGEEELKQLLCDMLAYLVLTPLVALVGWCITSMEYDP